MTVRYCIDTSSVIDAGERFYPIDIFPAFWDRLDDLILTGRLKAPQTLIDELKDKDDAWRDWVYARKNDLILPIDDLTQIAMGQVMIVYAAAVTNVDSIKGDPFFIATSMAHGFRLITSEAPRRGGVKIPRICDNLGVQWCPLLGMVRNEGWTF